MKFITCAICQQTWVIENCSEDEYCFTICQYCSENEIDRQWREKLKEEDNGTISS